jgi:hypothetical protein
MEKNWVCIYSTNVMYTAEIGKEVLSENNIDAVIINKKDSNYLFGAIEIYVERDNAIRGKHLLENLEK